MFLCPKATRGLEPISYRGALLSTLLHATIHMLLHNLPNVLVQIANKMRLQKKKRQVAARSHFNRWNGRRLKRMSPRGRVHLGCCSL
jgi:hypothetical protein